MNKSRELKLNFIEQCFFDDSHLYPNPALHISVALNGIHDVYRMRQLSRDIEYKILSLWIGTV